MSVITSPEPIPLGERLITVEDLAALPSELPTGPVQFELDNGRLVIMSPPGDVHGAAEVRSLRSC